MTPVSSHTKAPSNRFVSSPKTQHSGLAKFFNPLTGALYRVNKYVTKIYMTPFSHFSPSNVYSRVHVHKNFLLNENSLLSDKKHAILRYMTKFLFCFSI